MSGIAELLVNLGYEVSGSDMKPSDVTNRLQTLGVRIHAGHAADHLGDADVVVMSSAVRQENPEIVAARRRSIPVIPRAEMLAELMRLRYGIAIAGAHGKTTTTSMIALVLEQAGLDPTAVIGGRLSAFGSNARLGRGEYMVAEADESDRSFLKLSPTLAVLTNIDDEHLESYASFDDLRQAFLDFANKVPFYGSVVLCADDPHLSGMRARMTRRVIAYGISARDADILGTDLRFNGFDGVCTVRSRGALLGELRLHVPGRHNLQNALAAVAVGLEVGLEFPRIAAALATFHGAERRFQRRGEVGGVLVVDDYGHHPTELAAVLQAARGLNRRILVVFQPHRYTRTKRLLREFGPALAGAEEILLTDIYSAGEEPMAGASLDALAAAMRETAGDRLTVVPRLEDLPGEVARRARPGDLVIVMGAGSIGGMAERVVAELDAGRDLVR
jgi:UDP-N-acetylmuramate--alanine ligase